MKLSLILIALLNAFLCISAMSESEQDICDLPKSRGLCRGMSMQYFFNTKTQNCEEFIYGGCFGNGNRFESLEECQEICMSE
ncbi:unnamed protein product [Hermetia illucens]|uniref:BPTI/Kunitz inhibitor domain-containing protein n=1 Tax=Hermetia illucens TaxID=343691 RepID=A0A7R8USX6_HERIL|nr:kappaPI-actitoxin-Avd3d-like [Hermetia illucens]CAD7086454.1 unnamed protein product [Hermetia illucens]